MLNKILSNDNEVRKQAEAQLNEAKSTDTDKYALVLAGSFHPNQTAISVEAKCLAAVILRRNVSLAATDAQDLVNQANNANLWKRLSDPAREALKQCIL